MLVVSANGGTLIVTQAASGQASLSTCTVGHSLKSFPTLNSYLGFRLLLTCAPVSPTPSSLHIGPTLVGVVLASVTAGTVLNSAT